MCGEDAIVTDFATIFLFRLKFAVVLKMSLTQGQIHM